MFLHLLTVDLFAKLSKKRKKKRFSCQISEFFKFPAVEIVEREKKNGGRRLREREIEREMLGWRYRSSGGAG